MDYKELEVVVLARDLPEQGLRAGDIGTVVTVYPKGGLEVEFVRGSGMTQAVLTLSERDIRRLDANDLLTTRRLARVG